MEEIRHLTNAVAILEHVHYITLATVCADGSPWNSPVFATLDGDLNFSWRSSPTNMHSQNIARDGRAFVVVYDSTIPAGAGEGVYFTGTAEKAEQGTDAVSTYRFTPTKAWISDVAKNEDGSYKHDIRVELVLSALKEALR